MPRKVLDQELHRLKTEVLVLGVMVERSLLDSVEALQKRDLQKAQRVLELDRKVNAHRFALQNDTIVLIATQQPMARDLRLLASILEIASELERMGDYAKGIARITLRLGDRPLAWWPIDIPVMASKAADMLHRTLSAFMSEDAAVARAIPQEDDEVDAFYVRVYRGLITWIVQDPSVVEQANWYLWAAHNIERFADRVTNLCERIVFIATGEIQELDVYESPVCIESPAQNASAGE